jgi:hypothetical protein
MVVSYLYSALDNCSTTVVARLTKKSLKAPFGIVYEILRLEDTSKVPSCPWNNKRRRLKLLSRDCDGCSQMRSCNQRYCVVEKGDKVYCPDGTAHLVDGL